MSQQEQPQQSQPTVRHIPIFVEGRSEPLVNKIPESQPSNNSSTSSMPEPPPMEMPSHNTSDFFKHGSIFDRTRDFPVRTFPNSTFFNKSSPARESSPARQVPIFTDGGFTATTVPLSQQPPSRGSSQPRQMPSPQCFQQQPQQEQEAKQQASAAQDQTDSQPKPPPAPTQPAANDPISKIQKIQRDVLAIFDQVERFQGGKEGKRDKTYIYLDEMLTQNLLKLDSIDAEDQPQIKSARKEAIKSINHCIAVLEAKAEAGVERTNSNEKVPNGTTDRTGSGASLSHSSSNQSSQQGLQQQ
ncbi:BAG domain-containing protein Samui [Wyeomyia smithii]|uniref:BAG domain-containing protein Samui n=1 Tax=Wyeomyia smithii TaxID=174621 RepID=UPI002467D034|nr:BAG domain-containing protein Samui [Wyeomyia smithii]XP_055535651.1 BAG domain-containing protein Samui [Wyeomyia smithii]